MLDDNVFNFAIIPAMLIILWMFIAEVDSKHFFFIIFNGDVIVIGFILEKKVKCYNLELSLNSS